MLFVNSISSISPPSIWMNGFMFYLRIFGGALKRIGRFALSLELLPRRHYIKNIIRKRKVKTIPPQLFLGNIKKYQKGNKGFWKGGGIIIPSVCSGVKHSRVLQKKPPLAVNASKEQLLKTGKWTTSQDRTERFMGFLKSQNGLYSVSIF